MQVYPKAVSLSMVLWFMVQALLKVLSIIYSCWKASCKFNPTNIDIQAYQCCIIKNDPTTVNIVGSLSNKQNIIIG